MFRPTPLCPRILMIDTLKITDFVIPRFPKHVRFKYNKPRDEWVILAPERLVKLDDIAVEILKQVDGKQTVNQISRILSEKFNAPVETILADTIEMLQSLSDKGFIEENG